MNFNTHGDLIWLGITY